MRAEKYGFPPLLQFEVLNALKYCGLFNRDELKQAAESLGNYPFLSNMIKGEMQETMVEIAVDHEFTIYDAAYVSLAIGLGIQLITADDKIKKKLPGKYKKHVQVLAELT